MRQQLACSALVLAAFGFGVAPARAQNVDNPEQAQVLFDQAVELANGGNYHGACAKLEESLKLHDGLGTSFHLAGCWQKLGRTASAYALFEQVAAKAHELGQGDREELARARVEALLPKLSRVRVDLTEPAPHTEVYRDGKLLEQSDWGKPVPVDRGSHEIRVTAEGKAPWSTKVDVSEPATTIAVQVPALADPPKPAPEPVATPAPVPAPKAAPAPEAAPAPDSWSGNKTLAIVVGGVGIAALGGGILEGAQYLHTNREARGLCPSGLNCTNDEISRHADDIDKARGARTWAYVGIGVGTAAVAAATYLYFRAPGAAAPRSRQRAMALSVQPLTDGRGSWGGSLLGSF